MIGDYQPSLIQITNIAPSVQSDQIKSLFTYIGKIDSLVMYPLDSLSQCSTRICFIKFNDKKLIDASLHLNNTVFIDRAIIVVPSIFAEIPQEFVALQYLTPSDAVSAMLPVKHNWPPYITNQIIGIGGDQKIDTCDPLLHVQSLPHYPPLNAVDIDAYKIDDLRRTVYVSNLPQSTTAQQVVTHFHKIGDVQYVRMARNIHTPTISYAFVEFYDQRSVPSALVHNGSDLNGQAISVAHAFRPILKNSINGANSRELEDAMKKVDEAQALISAAVDTEKEVTKRSRSKERSRRSRSRAKRSRSHNTHSRVRRSRSRGRRSHSRGRRSRSRTRRSRSRGRRSRSRGYRSRNRRSSVHRSSRRTRSRSIRCSKRSRSRHRVRKRSKSSHRRTSHRHSRSSSANRPKKASPSLKTRKSRSTSPKEFYESTKSTKNRNLHKRSVSKDHHTRKRSRSRSLKRSSRHGKRSPHRSRKSRERKDKRNNSSSRSRDIKKHKKKSKRSSSRETKASSKPSKRNYDSEEDSKEVIDLESNSDIIETIETAVEKNGEIDSHN